MKNPWNLVPVILALVVTAVPAVASASEADVPTAVQQEQTAGTQTPVPVPTVGPHASECSQTEAGLEVDVILPVQGALGFPDGTLESAGSCFLACYDLETSHETFGCPEGQNFAMDATGPFSSCCLVGGGECVTSGCTVLASQCKGFASSCSGSC